MQYLVSISCTKKSWVSFVLFLWVILFLKNIERSEKWNQHWNPKPTLKSNQFQSHFESNSKINSKTKIRDCLHEEREGTKSGTGRSFYPAFRAIYLRSGTGDGTRRDNFCTACTGSFHGVITQHFLSLFEELKHFK